MLKVFKNRELKEYMNLESGSDGGLWEVPKRVKL
jgi:hypothetical protein